MIPVMYIVLIFALIQVLVINTGSAIELLDDLNLRLPCQPQTVHLSTILPEAKIDFSSLTLSGFSSGAIMAVQYHFAHSSEVKGAGIFAGIPYATFYGNALPLPPGVLQFLTGPNIVGPVPIVPLPLITTDNSKLKANAEEFAKTGLIDDPINLIGDKVYVFHGKVDTVVNQVYGERLVKMYEDFGAKVRAKMDIVAEHTVPTDNFPTSINDCINLVETLLIGGMSNCDYEGTFDMFNHFYGDDYKASESSDTPHTGKFSAFHQGPYTRSGDAVQDFMDSKGYLYVPEFCQDEENTCKIHIAFHGCFQNIYNDLVCNNFALNQGYLQVADANNVVIIFPQAATVQVDFQLKTNVGCWDFFGGTSNTAWFKTGLQIASVRKISRAVAKLH